MTPKQQKRVEQLKAWYQSQAKFDRGYPQLIIQDLFTVEIRMNNSCSFWVNCEGN